MSTACQILEISRSSFYEWNNRVLSQRALDSDRLLSRTRLIFNDSRQPYGYLRIQASLKQDGLTCGKNRVYRLIKKSNIQGCIKKRFKVKTTDSQHDLPIAPRIFKTEEQSTHPTRLNALWVSDISYIETLEGVLYLGTFLDVFTRKIVGFSIDDHMRTDLLLTALDMAIGRLKNLPKGCLSHSDRGSQYASEAYRERMKSLNITVSMSRKGNCYDNAFAETFFATLKKELVY